MSRRAAAITAGGALLMGSAIGVGSSQSARDELDAAAAKITTLEASIAASQDEHAAVAADLESLTDTNAELERVAAEHNAVVAAEQATATKLRGSIAELESDLAATAEERDTAQARVRELELLIASQPAPPTSSQQGTQQSLPVGPATPVYFKNCAAARAAGAAPVRVGDPGYGSHLDRDGDGIGCE